MNCLIWKFIFFGGLNKKHLFVLTVIPLPSLEMVKLGHEINENKYIQQKQELLWLLSIISKTGLNTVFPMFS